MFLFISEVIFWIQHSSDTSCIETLPFIPAQDMLGLSSNLLWFCVKHQFSSTQKTNTWNQLNIDPWKLTWNLKIIQLKRKLIFRTSILVFHVKFSRGVTKPPFKIHPRHPCSLQTPQIRLILGEDQGKTPTTWRFPAAFKTQPCSAFGQSSCYKFSISEVRHENCKTPLVHQNRVMFFAWFSSDSKGIRSD